MHLKKKGQKMKKCPLAVNKISHEKFQKNVVAISEKKECK